MTPKKPPVFRNVITIPEWFTTSTVLAITQKKWCSASLVKLIAEITPLKYYYAYIIKLGMSR